MKPKDAFGVVAIFQCNEPHPIFIIVEVNINTTIAFLLHRLSFIYQYGGGTLAVFMDTWVR